VEYAALVALAYCVVVGLGLTGHFHTSAAVHFGRAHAIQLERAHVLQTAYVAHPERFVRHVPVPPQLPGVAWINKPTEVMPAP
jgi:putative transposase